MPKFNRGVVQLTPEMFSKQVQEQFKHGVNQVKDGLKDIENLIAVFNGFTEKQQELRKVADDLKQVIASLEQTQSHL